MATTKKYWKSVDELDPSNKTIEALKQNEFSTPIPTEEFLGDDKTLSQSQTSRRDFLKYVGFSTAAASLAACEGPVIHSVPYVVQPERLVPGMSNYYATAIADGYDFASVLVKTREGRPIKIESNRDAGSRGKANARVHASVLSLYDTNRLKQPLAAGRDASWDLLDKEIPYRLEELRGKELVLLTQTYASPSIKKLIEEFKGRYGNVRHVVYDTVGEEAALEAFQNKYGKSGLADYDFTDAECIVGIGADFVGDWQGSGFDNGYSKSRIPENGNMSHHVQFEANMSLSGANSDERYPATPYEQKQILAALYSRISGGSGSGKLSERLKKAVDKTAKSLQRAGSNGVVLCGLPDVDAQNTVLAINESLGSNIIDTDRPILTRQGDRKAVKQLVEDMQSGSVGAIMIAGVDPVYCYEDGDAFAKALQNVDLKISFASRNDATAGYCDFVATTPHYLESWGDTEIKEGQVFFTQPLIQTIFDTRQMADSLLTWMGENKEYKDYLKEHYTGKGIKWAKALQDGFADVSSAAVTSDASEGVTEESEQLFTGGSVSASSSARKLSESKDAEGMDLVLYTKVSMGDGTQIYNPWLQELPDPITRTTWDNYLTMSAKDAADLDIKNENVADGGLNGGYATVTMGEKSLKLPVLIQPGQAVGTVGIALGYGQEDGIQEEMQTGVNAFPFFEGGVGIQKVKVEKAGGVHEFACTQLQNTMMGRDIIRETTLETYNTEDKHEWNPMPEVSLNHIETEVTSPDVDLWEGFDRSVGHHFNMSIDLNACTGCAACVVACHAENNVPVVGKEEVRRSRDMHWLRIDRYYSSEESFSADEEKKDNFSGLFGDGGSLSGFGELEEPSDNPDVAFQPLMCQHCNHAPCETVCPVAASAHGRQGQNHMTYNRCVGTRYCANNCPYKVRRFNWFLYNQNDEFDYHMNNDLGRMVLNPDVTVRSRGVMEKCSLCIQMTQMTILEAKKDGRSVEDGEFQTACSSACMEGAITFGDINDKESEIWKVKQQDRMYHLLEEIGTENNVMYQVKVRNTNS